MELKAGILAIGNEVVEGQIIDSHGAWLSRELGDIGFQVLFHLSCPDSFVEIKEALDFLSQHCQLILTSGGLGPTVDDITRDCLSQWTGRDLEFKESQWEIIKNRLEKRQVILREGHKNQACIPRGAGVLFNSQGVAPGFFVKTSRFFLASLPGPPLELRPMFEEQLKGLIQKELNPKKEKKLYTWLCFGVPESEIAHKTEKILGNSFEFGFRLFKPYVEIKIWASVELSEEEKKLFREFEEKMKPFFVAYDLFEIRKKFYGKLKIHECVYVLDYLSSGLFLEKLNGPFPLGQIQYQCFGKKNLRYFREDEIADFFNQKDPVSGYLLGLFPKNQNSVFIVFDKEIRVLELQRGQFIHSHSGRLFIIESVFLMVIKKFPEGLQPGTD